MSETAQDTAIVMAVIYPSIGVARLGNAPEGYVAGPGRRRRHYLDHSTRE